MKRQTLWPLGAILLAFILLNTVSVPKDLFGSSPANGIQWYSYAEGMAVSQSQNKKILINFWAEWCRYCRSMDTNTFADSSVVAYINRNFIPIRVNSDNEPKTANRYNVRGLPNTFFLSARGEKIANRPGYIPPKEMLSILKYIASGSYEKMSFSKFMDGH
jgi:thioredoxin-related protein